MKFSTLKMLAEHRSSRPLYTEILLLMLNVGNLLYMIILWTKQKFDFRLFYIPFSEFMPYVFQILSLMLELHSSSIPESYLALFPHLLQPVLWERLGNIPPLVRLLQVLVLPTALTGAEIFHKFAKFLLIQRKN